MEESSRFYPTPTFSPRALFMIYTKDSLYVDFFFAPVITNLAKACDVWAVNSYSLPGNEYRVVHFIVFPGTNTGWFTSSPFQGLIQGGMTHSLSGNKHRVVHLTVAPGTNTEWHDSLIHSLPRNKHRVAHFILFLLLSWS